MSNPTSTVLHRKAKPADLWPILVGTALVTGFFAAHQAWSTGFFTTGFGILETVLFYAAVLPAVIPATAAIYLSRKHELLADIAVSIVWTAAAAWLYVTFPFSFTHLAAVVPSPLQFAFNWISNDIGRILIGIATIGAFAFIPFFTLQYFARQDQTIGSR